ncbi:hypothetical protein R1flu_011841 [Riccia fluitans]|uniref:Uncharacterized protein n=1 Tax=Riccia fluitans TaxID=41844 RepID=A0ABD1ZBG4_9MARC
MAAKRPTVVTDKHSAVKKEKEKAPWQDVLLPSKSTMAGCAPTIKEPKEEKTRARQPDRTLVSPTPTQVEERDGQGTAQNQGDRLDLGTLYTDEEIRRAYPSSAPGPDNAGLDVLANIALTTTGGKTVLDQLAECSRLEAATGTLEDMRAANEVLHCPGIPYTTLGETLDWSMA